MKKIVLVVFILSLLLASLGCAPQKTKPASQQPIRIGVMAVLSGEAADIGAGIKNGLDLALKEINNSGGILDHPIQLVYEDSHLDLKEGTNIINKFIDLNHLSLIISAEGSGVTLGVAPIAERKKIIVIAAVASAPEIKNAGEYIFRVIPSDAAQGKAMAHIAHALGCKTVSLLFVNDSYGAGIKDTFVQNFDGQILNLESFTNEGSDFKTQLTKIKLQPPGGLILVARKEYPRILKQIRELNINSKIITSEMFKNETMLNAVSREAEGVITQYYTQATDYANYQTKYFQKYNSEPANYSDYGYDALMVLADAIKRAGALDTEKVKAELYHTDYKGATGEIRFDADGEVMDKPFTVYQVQNGKFVEFKF